MGFPGEICMYGTLEAGAGYTAVAPDGSHVDGDGTPCNGRGFTTALYLACEALRLAGVRKAWVYDQTGDLRARVHTSGAVLYCNLKWVDAPRPGGRSLPPCWLQVQE